MDAQSSLQRQNKVRRLGHLTTWNLPHDDGQKQPLSQASRKETILRF
jgi:hypothetical protein